MTDVQSLIDRLEKATGPDRALDGDIALFLRLVPSGMERGWDAGWSGGGKQFHAEWYTLSIDAALMLKPDSWEFVLWTENGLVEAYPTKGVKRPAGIKFRIQGHAPAIALCIAALKARQAAPHEMMSNEMFRTGGTRSRQGVVRVLEFPSWYGSICLPRGD